MGNPAIIENQLSQVIVDVAFHGHRKVGPGLLESVYETILVRSLTQRGLSVVRQQVIPIQFEELTTTSLLCIMTRSLLTLCAFCPFVSFTLNSPLRSDG